MRARLAAVLPGVVVLDGTAEAIPLEHDEVDAIIAGEAFHWFQTRTATAEIARVLKADGAIVLLWNTPTWTAETTPWLEDFRRLVAHRKRAAGEYPAAGTWRQEFERSRLFENLEHVEFTHEQTLDPSGFVAQVASWSWIANLEEERCRAVLQDVATLVERQGTIVIPYRTDLFLARRRGAPARPAE
jgi:ubiquinone/menaquinone biosynthesis C-methylase UbiE